MLLRQPPSPFSIPTAKCSTAQTTYILITIFYVIEIPTVHNYIRAHIVLDTIQKP